MDTKSVNDVAKGLDTDGIKKDSVIRVGTSLVGQNITWVPTFWYSPELTTESWLLPKSRQEILKWVRVFYNLEPYVRSVIDMHAEFPFSRFSLIVEDSSIRDFYEEQCYNENFDIFQFLVRASLSYWKFGECIIFSTKGRDESGATVWRSHILLEPELVEVRREIFEEQTYYELIPTEELRALVRASDPVSEARKAKIPPIVIESVMAGRNIPLDPSCVSHIAELTDPSALRGTPLIQSLFKCLIYQDFVRLAQIAIAMRYQFPIEVWTLGDPTKDIYPTAEELAAFRDLINRAVQSPPFAFVFPPVVRYEAHTPYGKMFPIRDHYEYILDQILVGLGVSKNLILGEGPSLPSAFAIPLQRLISRYRKVRDMFEHWLVFKFFKPLAVANGFYVTTKDGRKKYILPKIVWQKTLDPESDRVATELLKELHRRGYVSTETLFSRFPYLNVEIEKKRIESERGTVWDKEGRIPPKREGAPTTPTPTLGPPLGLAETLPSPAPPPASLPETAPAEAVETVTPPEAATLPETVL